MDIYTRLESLLGLRLSGHTNTLTEASNLLDELYKRGELQNKQQFRNALDKFSTQYLELPSNLLEQIAFNTRPMIEEHMLVVMDISTHEDHLSHPLQTINKQYKLVVTFPTGYNGTFNDTEKNIKFYFANSLSDEDGFIQILIPKSAYELESLYNEIRMMIIEEEHYTDAKFSITIKPNFSTLGSILEVSTPGPVISFVLDDSIRDLLGFNATKIKKIILSIT